MHVGLPICRIGKVVSREEGRSGYQPDLLWFKANNALLQGVKGSLGAVSEVQFAQDIVTCPRMVCSEITNSSAISLLLKPLAINLSTSISQSIRLVEGLILPLLVMIRVKHKGNFLSSSSLTWGVP